MARNKISLVGAGNIGGTLALLAGLKQLGDVTLFDIAEGIPQGKALDIAQASPIEGFDAVMEGSNGYEALAGSDVVIVTAGLPRKPGMSRDDLIQTNVKIVKSVSEQIAKHAPESVVIVVANPLDAMVYTAWKTTGFPTNRIIGQAGCLDVARFCTFIAMEIGCSVEDVTALLLGGHGDDMVPLPRFASVHGIPVQQLLSDETIQACVDRAKVGGGEIVKLMGTSAYYAPASGSVQMAEAIIKDKKRILPCAGYCDAEYGVGGYFVGVPCVLGANGMEQVIEIDLDADEKVLMDESVSHVKDLVKVVRDTFPELV